jgi:ABC-2 type transport system ATP-binding protein
MLGPAISTEDLTKRFGKLTALDRLTLDVAQGEVFGYLGPNGAGKSTTLRLLLALAKPTSGRATILGVDVAKVSEVHRHLAYVPGDVNLWPRLTGAECLELLGDFHGAVDTGYRNDLVERFHLDTSKKARTYSKGNRQKVALIAAFATRAEVLLLDEPTSGLDPLMEKEFRKCVHEASAREQTVLLSSHILSEVEALCTRVGILRAGRLVEVATIDHLRSLHHTELELDFAGPAPEIGSVPGVAKVTPIPTGLRVTLNGPPGPLLLAIDNLPLVSIRAQEASLEEIFLTYYGNSDEVSEATVGQH